MYLLSSGSNLQRVLTFRFSLLETVQSCFLVRELYCYTVLAIADPIHLFIIDWYVQRTSRT